LIEIAFVVPRVITGDIKNKSEVIKESIPKSLVDKYVKIGNTKKKCLLAEMLPLNKQKMI
jgi:hypothetical protein